MINDIVLWLNLYCLFFGIKGVIVFILRFFIRIDIIFGSGFGFYSVIIWVLVMFDIVRYVCVL